MSTFTMNVPGATLTYDVHGELSPDAVPLVLVGSPMDASGFTTLASQFTDRTVVTYDPRNTGRSKREDPTSAVTTAQHAEDLHAVLHEWRCDHENNQQYQHDIHKGRHVNFCQIRSSVLSHKRFNFKNRGKDCLTSHKRSNDLSSTGSRTKFFSAM